MIIIGCDFHPSWQQVAWLDTETGESDERRLVHAAGEAEPFYRQWPAPALIGMESTGNCQWLIDLLNELGHEVWIGDAAQIRATMVRQQKTDRRDAAHLLELLVEGRFPRIWVPSSGERDQRQLLIHRYKLVTLRAQTSSSQSQSQQGTSSGTSASSQSESQSTETTTAKKKSRKKHKKGSTSASSSDSSGSSSTGSGASASGSSSSSDSGTSKKGAKKTKNVGEIPGSQAGTPGATSTNPK